MSRDPSRRLPIPALVAVMLALSPAATRAEPDPPARGFLRVHVPQGRLPDVPIGPDRYVPMPAAEFEQAVRRLATGAAVEPRPTAERSLYELAIDEAGRLAGRLAFEVVTRGTTAPREIDLGAVRPGRCRLRTAVGTGDAVVFGSPHGAVTVKITEPGTYECDLSVPPEDGGGAFQLPLVPALATTVRLQPPPGRVPRLSGEAAGDAIMSRGEDGRWRIDFGPAASVGIEFVADDGTPPPVAAWADVRVRPRRIDLTTVLVPRTAWHGEDVSVVKPPALRITAVRLVTADTPLDWRETADGSTLLVRLPRGVPGQRTPVVVEGTAPLEPGDSWPVPRVRPAGEAWGGGGVRLEIDPALGVVGVAADQCLAVTPEAAARWPLPGSRGRSGDGPVGAAPAALRPAVMQFEDQAGAAAVALTLRPREPQLDVGRVTTVELGPARVQGRAACDVRVVTGEAFALTGRVARGWIIDAVQVVDSFDMAFDADGRPHGDGAEIDWRIENAPDGSQDLRIGLALAATPRRSLGLRVLGHRAGVALGGGFRTADMDMVQFAGESADGAVIDFEIGPDAVVEVEGEPVGVFDLPPRLARLVEPGTLRGRLAGGARAADRAARLVQRRPPLDVRSVVRLTVQDERLDESFTLTCRPAAAAVDSIVVHFSEPMVDGLEWTLVEPAAGAVVARRLDAADRARGEGLRIPGCAESWLVEVTPAFLDTATIRARRTVPFREPRPVPLAWVDGATTSHGTVAIDGDGTMRPTVINRRLQELPPAAADGDGRAAAIEFAFAPPRAGEDAEPAALLAPPATAEARSWVWSESVTCRCHESGRAECETVFDIENHGRDHVALTMLPGRQVESVVLDDLPVLAAATGAGGVQRVDLPPNRRRVRLVVRTLVTADPRAGTWRVDPVGCTLDVPVFDHRLRLVLPPGLDVAAEPGGFRRFETRTAGIWERLGGASFNSTAAGGHGAEPQDGLEPQADGSREGGFHSLSFVPASGRVGSAAILIRRSLMVSIATLAACFGFMAAFTVARRRPGTAAAVAAIAALLALWLEPPWFVIPRAAWWGAVAGGLWAWRLSAAAVRVGAAGLTVAAVSCLPVAAAAQSPAAGRDAFRVFITPAADDGALALVPEPLFRDLVRATRPAAIPLRIVRCRVVVDEDRVPAAWRMVLDVDADAGAASMLDQGPGDARWAPLPGTAAGVTVEADGRVAHLVAAAAGSRRIELGIAPAVERRGRLQLASIRLPPAAAAALELVAGSGEPLPAVATAVQCDRSVAGGPFLRVAAGGRAGNAFDVSGADCVRLVRPLDARDRLDAGGLTAVSENDVAWRLDACEVRARFDVAGDGIARAVVVRADPDLVPADVAAEAGQTIQPLGGGRYLLERIAPEPGAARFGIALRKPLADPVGVFEVPGVWLQGVAGDLRTVRLGTSADLAAALEPAPGQRSERVPTGGDVWRTEVGDSSPAGPPPRITVRRRPQDVRGSQSLAIRFEEDAVGLRLQGRIDATSTPLAVVVVRVPPRCAVERITVREDDLAAPDAGVRPPLDVQWTRTAVDQLTVFVQQPRAGRYRLDIEASLAGRPPARGRLPLVRADLGGSTPLAVAWSRAGDPAPRAVIEEVPEGGDAPMYELAARSADEAEPGRIPPAGGTERTATASPAERIERAMVTVAVDGRGRLRGSARYDLVTARSAIRLRLPARSRLFSVLVDGSDVTDRPVAVDTWEVPLDGASWPRSLMILYAGEFSPPPSAGKTTELQPPVIEDLPCTEVLWTVSAPAGRAVLLGKPTRPLADTDWDAAVGAARERIADAFARALVGVEPTVAERLRSFAATRTAGQPAPLESAWQQALEPPAGDRVRFATAATAGVRVRFVSRADASALPRLLATWVLVAAAVAWRWAARRGPMRGPARSMWAAPSAGGSRSREAAGADSSSTRSLPGG